MRLIYILIGVIISSSCTNSTQNQTKEHLASQQKESNSPSAEPSSDSRKWTDNFLEFKKAILANDRKTVKSFIDFPIKNKGNEIWYLADSRLLMEINPDKVVPFNESDFDKYYSSIFSLDFRKTLEKVNLDDFFKTHNSSSPEIEVVKGSKSKLEASFDKSTQKVTLTLLTTGQDFSEFAIQYEFDVMNGQNLKFKQVHVAG